MKRVLILDDEEIVLVGLRDTLRREGYEVVTAESALTGLEALKAAPFAVIITDQQMPWMTGLEFLSQAKQIQPEATRVLITAVLDLETVVDAINEGEIYRFIIKPWLREELLATVSNGVQRYHLTRSNAELHRVTTAMNQKLTDLNRSLEEQMGRVEEQNQQLLDLNGALQTNLESSVRLCLHVMQTFYPTLGGRARQVHNTCQAMAQALSLSVEDRQTLEISAWLHDIGLVGVPRTVIRRWEREPANLNEAERTLIEQHPVLGQELVEFVHHLNSVGAVIRAHHERFDGGGYPDQVSGENIPWLSRLLAVAVSYAESPDDADDPVARIQFASGSAFDPEAVRAFLRVLPKANLPRTQREVLLSELRPGMVLAQGIYTSTGLLLIPEGKELSAPAIDKVLNHNRIQPIRQALAVYC